MKKAMLILSLLGIFAIGASAEGLIPQTGVTAPLLPWFIGLMVIAVIAIIVCLILMRKKK